MAQFLTPAKKMNTGEKRFADLLKDYLNDDYLVWFDVPTHGNTRRYPDFLIFHPRHGLLCIEVKDWVMGGISAITQEHVVYGRDNNRQVRTHPIRQARECFLPIIEYLQKDPTLLQPSGKYQGKLMIPWGYGAVMWRWERHRVKQKMNTIFEELFPIQKTFFKEDLEAERISQDDFIRKLHGLFPYQFEYGLTTAQISRIRGCIFPEFIVGRQGELFGEDVFDLDEEVLPDLPDVLHIMDNEQEKLARNMGGGHRVIHGVAGSGKTIILEHRARKLAEEASADKPVLVLCYNIVLAARLRSHLSQPYIEVRHFHGWCIEMRKRYQLYVPRNGQYVKALEDTVCTAVADGRIPSGLYHAVLIDEGHDFAEDWLTALAKMPDPNHEHLLLLYDDAQTIYDNRSGIGFTLSSVGIKAVGRTKKLKINYRNSYEILTTAELFIQHFLVDHDADEDGIPLLTPQANGRTTGIEPIFRQYTQRADEFAGIVKQIQQWQACGVALGDIAVLYYSNDFARALASLLEIRNIAVQFLIDKPAKEAYHAAHDKITLCSIASSKGSEFGYVILSGLGQCNDTAERREQSARLIYVGMTRAINELVMTAHNNNTFTALLAE